MNRGPKPTKILVVAPFCGSNGKNEEKPRVITIDKYSIKEAFQRLEPFFFKRVTTHLVKDLEISFSPRRLKDFSPDGLLKKAGGLAELVAILKSLEDDEAKQVPQALLISNVKRLWPHIDLALKPQDQPSPPKQAKEPVTSAVEAILKKVSIPGNGPRDEEASNTKPPGTAFKLPLSQQVQKAIGEVLGAIYADPGFRAMEEAWRGLWFLVKQGDWEDGLELDLLSVEGDESAAEIENYFRDCPMEGLPALVLVDHAMASTPLDLETLHQLARVAESNLVPIAISLSPSFFHCQSWDEFQRLPYLPNHLKAPHYARWQHLVTDPSSRWLITIFNRFLLRGPHGTITGLKDSSFSERGPLWGDGVWTLGALCGKSISHFGWPTCFHRHRYIYLDGLDLWKQGPRLFIPTRIYIDEERQGQLAACGISPLVCYPNMERVFMPKDTSVSGHSFSYQMMLALISHCAIILKERLQEEARDKGGLTPSYAREVITSDIDSFLNRGPLHAGFHISIHVSRPNDDTLFVSFKILPPPDLLHPPHPIELNFTIGGNDGHW